MTVQTSNITSGPYAGNGIVTQFDYTFRISDETELTVFETNDVGAVTTLTLGGDYTVAGVGADEGGVITRVAGALPTGYSWYIRSNYQATQETSFDSQGGFFPGIHEDSFDKLTFLAQQLNDRIGRAFRFSDSYSGSVSPTLPSPLAGAYVRWSNDGTALINDTDISVIINISGAVAAVAAIDTEVAAVAANAANINEVAANIDTVVAAAAAAESSASAASASATLAMDWASKTDAPVAGGEFSAKYWAQQAAASVTLPGAGIAVSTGTTWGTSLTAPDGDLVGTTATQTLTNKTITDPIMTLGGDQGVAGQVPISQGPGLPPVYGEIAGSEIIRVARTSNIQITSANNGNLIDITSGTFTQTFDAAATIGDGWFCYIQNSGSGDITLDPDGTETIDSLTSFIMYPGEVRIVYCDGVAFRSIVLVAFNKVFTSSGTFVTPPGYIGFEGELFNGGTGGQGGGGWNTSFERRGDGGSGGGGGSYREFNCQRSELGSTVSVVVGAGGAGGAGSAGGANVAGTGGTTGGTSSFGSIPVPPVVSPYGTGGVGGTGESSTAISPPAGVQSGGGGGGGGMGGSSNVAPAAGGSSVRAGAGGAGATSTSGNGNAGSAGVAPSGGGGGGGAGGSVGSPSGAGGTGGAGARGEVRVRGVK